MRVDAKVGAFWRRTTEGLSAEQLWTQFRRETRSSINLYSAETGRNLSAGGRLGLVAAVARAMFARLSPVRRILLLVAVFLLLMPQVSFKNDSGLLVTLPFTTHSSVILLFLLVLELADRVGLKRDLEIARDIQRILLPERPPAAPGIDIAFRTKPANTVAGDYYDAFLRPVAGDSRLILIVADVAGKGIPSGLLMVAVQTGFHMLAAEPIALTELAARLNRSMFERSGTGRHFTTAFIAELDCETREFTWVNAGHNPPLLIRNAGSVEHLEEGGFPLGIFMTAEYESGRTTLRPGDVLYVYTDGVSEAFNKTGAEYGEERLIRLAGTFSRKSAAESLDGIFQSVQQYAGEEPQSDDITCLVLRVQAADTAVSARA